MHRLEFGMVSDEISPDFNEAARYGGEWGISIFELRVLRTGRIPAVDQGELREVQALVKGNGLRITALSPGIFKLPLSQTTKLEEELSTTLPKTLALAREFGASLVIAFGFQREQNEKPEMFSQAVDFMSLAAEKAGKEGIKIIIENEPGFWCDSGANTAKLIQAVNSPFLRANWDPCNGYGTAERPFPEGYEAVKQYIANVHVKDTKEGSLTRCVPVGEGAVNWKGQLAALVRDQLVRHITIETHCLPLVEKSKQNVETLKQYLAEIYRQQETAE
jgi:sugar phosphate isomerase/epimerase